MSPASPWTGGSAWTRAGGPAAGARLAERPPVFRARGAGGPVTGAERVFRPRAPSRSVFGGRGHPRVCQLLIPFNTSSPPSSLIPTVPPLNPWKIFLPNTSLPAFSTSFTNPLLQGIFLTQGSNPGLPHCRQILYHLSHQGSLQRN